MFGLLQRLRDRRAGLAWVVTWQGSGEPGLRSSAFKSRREAEKFLSQDSMDSGGLIWQEFDIRADEVYPRLVERLGMETAPGVIVIGWGEHQGIELAIDPAWVAETTFATHDIWDDSRLNRTPRSIHPRRRGLEFLLFDIDETLSSMWERPTRLNYPSGAES